MDAIIVGIGTNINEQADLLCPVPRATHGQQGHLRYCTRAGMLLTAHMEASVVNCKVDPGTRIATSSKVALQLSDAALQDKSQHLQ